MPVDGLKARLPELGRLRAGDVEEREGKALPRKLATWKVTSPDHNLIEKAALLYGGEVEPFGDGQHQVLTETDVLQVLIPEQDIIGGQFMEEWAAGGLIHRCDGTTDLATDMACLRDGNGCKCKITTHLLVVLPELPGLGVFRLTSGSWNAAAELPKAVEMLQMIEARGALPHAELVLEQRVKRAEGATHRFAVPVLRLPYTLSQAGISAGGVDPLTGEIIVSPVLAAGEQPAVDVALGEGTTTAGGTSGEGTTPTNPGAGPATSNEAPTPSSEDTSAEQARSDGDAASSSTHMPADPSDGEAPQAGAIDSDTAEYPSGDVPAPEGEATPSGRGAPCLHLGGSKTVPRARGGTVDVCVDCGHPIEAVSA